MHAMKKQALCWALAGAAIAAAPAAMAVTTPMVLKDTLTELKLDWMWDGNTGVSNFNGTYWNAYLAPTLENEQWNLQVWYMHIEGPHGESYEHPGHALNYVITPGGSAIDGGVQDHLGVAPGTVAHANAHVWNIGTWTQADSAQGGFTAFSVTHVPEPATWLMLIGGLAVVGAGARRRG